MPINAGGLTLEQINGVNMIYIENKPIAPFAATPLYFQGGEYADNGAMRVSFGGTDRITVDLAASAAEGVFDSGFSVLLPKGDLFSILMNAQNQNTNWSDFQIGERFSLDTFYYAYGQFFLLRTENGVIRIGRQVRRKEDYHTGYMEKCEDGFKLVFRWEPQQPYPKEFSAQQLQFKWFDTMESACDEHSDWMASQFKLVPAESNPAIPAWFKNTKIVFQFNLGETNGGICHDYLDLCNFIEAIHDYGVPKDAIIYIPDYTVNYCFIAQAYNNFNINNPLYGGRAAFLRASRLAKDYGYHILPHLSLYLIMEWQRTNYTDSLTGERIIWRNAVWEKYKDCAVCTKSGRPIGWPPEANEIKGFNGPSDQYPYAIRYLNMNDEKVRRFYYQDIDDIIRDTGIDCLYFDSLTVNYSLPQISCWNSVSHNLDLRKGERIMIDYLRAKYPGILILGEVGDEETIDLAAGWQYQEDLWYRVYGRYCYTFDHTHRPSPMPMRYPNAGISPYDPKEIDREVAINQRLPHNIPRLSVNFRDFGLNDFTKACIDRLLDCRK